MHSKQSDTTRAADALHVCLPNSLTHAIVRACQSELSCKQSAPAGNLDQADRDVAGATHAGCAVTAGMENIT